MNSLTSLLPPIQKFRPFEPFQTEWKEGERLWGEEIFPGARLEFARGLSGLKFRFVFTPEADPTKTLWLQALMTMSRGLVSSKLFQFNAREVDSFLRVSALEPCLALEQNDLIKWDRELRKMLLLSFIKAIAGQNQKIPEKHVYVELTRQISSRLDQLNESLKELLEIELVSLELRQGNQSLKENRGVVSLKSKPGLTEFLTERDFLHGLELAFANAFLPLKWVAEGRDLP